MNAKEIRSKSVEELQEIYVTLNREKFNLKIQKATGQLSKPDRISGARKEIARILTILTEKRAQR